MFQESVRNFCPRKVSKIFLEGVGSQAFLRYENGIIPRRFLDYIVVN